MEKIIQTVLELEKKVVFFDVFDTIILRRVDPEYVKKIWAKRLSIQFGGFMEYQELYRLRNTMEAEMCIANNDSGMDMEFNYKELINSMYKVLIQRGLIDSSIDSKLFTSHCENIEIETEMSVQFIDPQWIEIVTTLKENNVEIYCVSDFYLTSEMMISLFTKHGIYKYIDKLYVSSEYLLTKKSGRFYAQVLQENNLKPSDVFMVGDNEYSDYEVPSTKGIDSYHLDRKEQHDFYASFRRQVENLNYYTRELVKISKKMSQKGNFLEISCSLFYYIDSLHKQLMKNNVKNIFFFSREGEFLLKLFNLYQKMEGYENVQYIKPHYLKVSRKSTFLPSLKSLDTESFETLFRQYINISIFDFLSSLNFEEELIGQVARNLNVDAYEKINDFPLSEQFSRLKGEELFREIYEQTRVEQKNNFLDYIDQFQVDLKQEGMHIVDVGWKGTIQDNIYRILDSNVLVEGYYLGLVASGDIQETNRKQGLLFSVIPCRTPYYNIFNENRALYEILLGASHGSANKYVRNVNIEVDTYQTEMERELFDTIISPIQDEIYMYFEELCNLFCKRNVRLEDFIEEFAKVHARMVLFPTKAELNFFNGLYHYENFGVFEYSTFSTKNPLDLKKTIRNTILLMRSPRSILEKGFWGPNTLENEGLGYLVPLYGRYKYKKSFKINKSSDTRNSSSSDQNNHAIYDDLHRSLEERDMAIKKMTQMIDDRDDAIKSMTKMIDDRDEVIARMTQIINEKDELRK
ncbi:HAD hydrolase-like protein [Paenibacillus glacialis]|uniref:Haloacid dehalogenase n=1 Tax=Paenibacillus glacialis TaxID=494026 RepID=A0A162MEE9_9BACL|nr:HAD hydrolase-like protein [Paenibacillus glacialis]OAB42993.1 hypothetical protein PGLA_11105 [Paenibacillus glacialis]